MTDDPNPTYARRRLAVRLRQARERNGRALDDLARELRVSLPQASRLDTGARGYQHAQVAQLTAWYGLGPNESDLLAGLAEESRRRVWWQQVDLPDSYRTFIGLEKGARSIDEFGGSVVPGLLQTSDYARAAAMGSSVDPTVAEIDLAVDVRIRRQAALLRADPPTTWFVLDEAVLARTTGGPAVMGAQMEHLLELSGTAPVTVQVVGFDQGTYLGSLHTHFIRLDFNGEIPDVAYADGSLGARDTEDPETVLKLGRVWDKVRALALNEADSRRRIDDYRSALKKDR